MLWPHIFCPSGTLIKSVIGLLALSSVSLTLTFVCSLFNLSCLCISLDSFFRPKFQLTNSLSAVSNLLLIPFLEIVI